MGIIRGAFLGPKLWSRSSDAQLSSGHELSRGLPLRVYGSPVTTTLDVMNDLWGEIRPSDWRQTPCVTGRPATENDVIRGRAVFYINGDSSALDIALPCCAIHNTEEGSRVPVVVIQAERAAPGDVAGVRPLQGGNAVCLLSELTLLPGGFPAPHEI
jgi:hypothetical protein